MAKRTGTKRPTRTIATPAIVPPTPAPVVTTDATPANVVRVLTFADFDAPEPSSIPAHIPAFVAGIRAIAPMPVKTFAERTAARDAFIAAVIAAGCTGSDTNAKHTGRFSTRPVFVAQNDVYACIAFANVAVESGHVMAIWAAEFPGSTCGRNVPGVNGVPYIGRDYAWSTLSEYVNGRHNACSFDNARIVIQSWINAGRKPRT